MLLSGFSGQVQERTQWDSFSPNLELWMQIMVGMGGFDKKRKRNSGGDSLRHSADIAVVVAAGGNKSEAEKSGIPSEALNLYLYFQGQTQTCVIYHSITYLGAKF